VHSILQRMRDLSVQATNSGSQDLTARQAAQTELAQLNSELDRIGKTTSFGASKLLDGTFGLQGATTVGNSGATQVTGTTATTVAAADVLTITLGTTTAAGAAGTDIVGLVTMVNTGAAATAGSITNDAAGAAALQTALQADIDASASLAKGLVTASVKYDSLTNKLSVNFTRTTATSANDDIAIGATSAGVKLGMAVTTTAPAGSGGSFQVGANNTSNDRISVAIGKVDSATLSTSTIDLTTSAAAAIDTIDAAIKTVSTTRANLGAYQNRFEHAINNLNVAVENLSASESRIRDTDMAQEMVAFTRSQILSQAGTSMLAQANQAPQSVLSLLR
jgi:flagellin